MKTGDTVRDGQGRSWQIGQLLGRGLWGRSWLVRREGDDGWHVLKCPLGPGDFRTEPPESIYAVCREATLEQARVYEQAGGAVLPRLVERLTLHDGLPAFVIPRYVTSLERRLTEGMPVADAVDVLVAVCRALAQLGSAVPTGLAASGVHGALRPSDILFNERGDVVLADVSTPAVRRALPRLVAAAGGHPYLPPEVTDAPGEAVITPVCDTYALAMMLWRVAGAPEDHHADQHGGWPRGGLDKSLQVAVKDRLLERLKSEDSNPRFHGRLADRVAILLARALSREPAPSPPYRFPRTDELQGRLEEAGALIRPRVDSIGKILLDRTAVRPWFQTDEAVAFSCNVGTNVSVDGQEEIGVGIALFDLDRDVRLKDVDLGYTVDKHPSGRHRFAFRLGALPPGRYRARVAFAIRDSGQPPITTEAELTVRAAPGWVPKPETAAPAALALREPAPALALVDVEEDATPPPATPPRLAVVQADPDDGPFGASPTAVPYPERPAPALNLGPAAPTDAAVVRLADASAAAPTTTLPPLTPTGGQGFLRTPAPIRPDPAAPPADAPRPPRVEPRIEPRVEPRIEPRIQSSAEPLRAEPPRPEISRPAPPADAHRLTRPFGAPVPAAPRPVLAPVPAPPARESDRVPPVLPTPQLPPAAPRAVATPPTPPPPPPEPAFTARDWSHEPLPGGPRGRDLDVDDGPPPDDEEVDEGPGVLTRLLEQLRTDPYIAVMAGLGAVIAVLLLVFLAQRSG